MGNRDRNGCDGSMISEKKIWFFHHYAVLPDMQGQIRPYNFGLHLKNHGWKATVFAASYLHHSDISLITDGSKYLLKEDEGVPFVFVNTPSSSRGMLARVWNMAAFYLGLLDVAAEYAQKYGKPKLIVASSPHPLTMIAGIKVAKKLGIPCVCEVRDLWPDAIFTFGKLKENSLLGRLLTAGEHWIYRKADAIIFTKEGDTDYLKQQRWDLAQGGDIDLNKCHYINNGVDIEAFERLVSDNRVEDPDLLADKFNVVYAGSLREVNDVGMLLDAAALLKSHTDIQFLIYGDGNQKDDLQQRVQKEQLHNVKIKGYVSKTLVPFILSRSGLNILNYSQEKYNWSRGNSSNKLFEYMASGKPIISTVKMGYCILAKYQCGLSLEAPTPQALASAILHVHGMPHDEYERMGENALAGAYCFDYRILTEKLVALIENVTKPVL